MAVFTSLSHEDILLILTSYRLGKLISYEGILQGVDNTNYKIITDTGPYILTIFESRIHPQDIPFFLNHMAHIAKNGIACPAPVARQDMDLTGTIHGKVCAIFSFLQGRDVKPDEITPALCAELGNLVGRMHVAGQTMPQTRGNSMSFDAWTIRLGKVGDKAEQIETGLTSFLSSEMGFIQANWPQNLPQGNVHLDLFPDNVFLLDEHIHGVIDFYFAATDFLAYDLAIIMNAWCFTDNGKFFDKERWDALFHAYESVRPFTPDEVNAFSILARGAAMRFISSRLHDLVFHNPQNQVTPKDPMEYINIIKYHRNNRFF